MSNPVEYMRRRQKQEARRVRKMIAVERDQQNLEAKTGRAGPTPETKAKVEPHAIDRLVSSGFLDSDDEHALSDIASAYMGLTASQGYASGSLDRVDHSNASAHQEANTAQQMRYSAWRDELARYGDKECHKFVIGLAVEGMSINKMARAFGRSRPTAAKRLRAGLDAYHQVVSKKKNKK